MNPWAAAARRALLVSFFMVVCVVLVRGFLHSWAELSQTDFWVEKAVLFGVAALVMTLVYRGLGRES
jgi:hypothetical protein